MTEDAKKLLFIIRYAGSDAGKNALDEFLIEVRALRSVAAAAHAFMQANPCDTRDHNLDADGKWLSRDDIDCDECHAVEQVREALEALRATQTGSEEQGK